MAYCSNCGNPLTEGQRFCASCGQQVGEVASAAPAEGAPPPATDPANEPVPPPASGAPGASTPPPAAGTSDATTPRLPPGWTYGPGTPGQPQSSAPPPSGPSRKGLWIALGAFVVVVAIACVLVFAVFNDQIFGDGGSTETTVSDSPATTQPIAPPPDEESSTTTDQATSTSGGATTSSTASTSTTEATSSTLGGDATAETPEEAVLLLFQAMADKDFGAFFAIMDPVALEEVTGGLSLDLFEEYMGDSLWDWETMEFSGLETETEMTSDTTAKVTIVAGTVTITDYDGSTMVEDVKDAGAPVELNVVERDGAWYLDPEAMFGPSGL